MKKNEWLEKVSLTDEKFIEEADPTARKLVKTRRKSPALPLVAAVALILVATMSLALLLPLLRPEEPRGSAQPTVSPSSNASEELIPGSYEELYAVLMYAQKNYGLGETVDRDDAEGDLMPPTDTDAAPDGGAVGGDAGDQYQETTDNQIEGVIEPDIFKRSDRYLYYIDRSANTLRIYSIDKEESEEVGSYQWEQLDAPSLFLSEDCKTVTVIGTKVSAIEGVFSRTTAVLALDVSDPANIVLKNKVVLSGSNSSVRMVDGKLLLIGRHSVQKYDMVQPESLDYCPFVINYTNDPEESKDLISEKTPYDITEIVYPKEPTVCDYTTVVILRAEDLVLESKKAFLSYNTQTHVNKENIYLWRDYTVRTEAATSEMVGSKAILKVYTDIVGIKYKDGSLTMNGKITLEGSVKDRYCLDEYDGILRIAATKNTYKVGLGDRILEPILYCVDLKKYEIAAKVTDFAPVGESVRSARFEGADGYICTAVRSTDPVFFFDLSDISNITYTDTGTIEGFSENLTVFGEGYLLGIGRGDSFETLKVEMYKEEDGKVISVDKFLVEDAYYWSANYNDYYIDRENGLIGIGVYGVIFGNTDFETEEEYRLPSRYLLLHFDGEKFSYDMFVFEEEVGASSMRSVYIDGYFYLMGNDSLQVQKPELKK